MDFVKTAKRIFSEYKILFEALRLYDLDVDVDVIEVLFHLDEGEAEEILESIKRFREASLEEKRALFEEVSRELKKGIDELNNTIEERFEDNPFLVFRGRKLHGTLIGVYFELILAKLFLGKAIAHLHLHLPHSSHPS